MHTILARLPQFTCGISSQNLWAASQGLIEWGPLGIGESTRKVLAGGSPDLIQFKSAFVKEVCWFLRLGVWRFGARESGESGEFGGRMVGVCVYGVLRFRQQRKNTKIRK